jgi:hypothetical protein
MMTNRELLKASKKQLTSLERRRRLVLLVESTTMPCPACDHPVNALEAAGVDVDDYDFGRTSPAYQCPSCAAELEQTTPPIGSGPLWYWSLKPEWLRAQLAQLRSRPKPQANDDMP